MAGLFKNKIISEKIERFEIPDFDRKISLVQSWQKAWKDGTLQLKNETQCEQAFNHDFFIEVLGYSTFPKDIYSLQPKDNVETGGGQLPDATLGYFTHSEKRVIAVVEIKDANTPLDKSQRRDGNLSPIQQAFKYKPQYKECSFVIATNFYEIRLFTDNQLDFEHFTLTELIDPKNDYFNFRKFYYLLCADNFIKEKGQTTTEKLLSEIRVEQEQITNKFYKEYKQLRVDLIKDIVSNNHIQQQNFYSNVVEKSQKIIDRLVFVCFFEDAGLLPQNKLIEVVDYAQKGELDEPIWDTLKKFFKAIDQGSDKLGVPNGYNGELFKEDTELNNLIISDEICKRFVELTKFDFEEDLSVNILGHIFEQSISDLERLKSFSDGEEIPEEGKEKKRKKDGIFYTPSYIVDYIVKNSLGKLLEEKEAEIIANYNLDDKRNKEAGYNKKIIKAYGEYTQFLRNLKILDPACGSGAFLVRVFDYLLAEHKRVSRIVSDAEGRGIGSALLPEEQIVKPILENNIYGVDLNPESVEITKLSLWLKSATKGQKLVTLKNNIKCGNSLIDDPEVAGERAFNWNKEFADILNSGGFDVIVGNPPYVNARTMQVEDRAYLAKNYPELQGSYDLYTVFLLKALELLKPTGKYGWIIPNKLLIADYAKKVFKKLTDTSAETVINISKIPVFKGVGVYPIILIGRIDKLNETLSKFSVELPEQLSGGQLTHATKNNFKRFKSFADFGLKINSGTTGFEAQKIKTLLNEVSDGIPFAVSGSIDPYVLDMSYVPYMKSKYKYPHITADSKEIATSKYNFWNSPKIVVAGMTKRLEAKYVPTPLALGVGVYGIYEFAGFNPKALTAVLNSNFLTYYLVTEFSDKHLAGGYLAINKSTLEQLPLIAIPEDKQKMLADYMDIMEKSLTNLIIENNNFQQLIIAQIGIKSFPSKLIKWWNLDFTNFIDIIAPKLSISVKESLLSTYNKYSNKLTELDNEQQRIQTKIDKLVYEIFNLSKEEIDIVESLSEVK